MWDLSLQNNNLIATFNNYSNGSKRLHVSRFDLNNNNDYKNYLFAGTYRGVVMIDIENNTEVRRFSSGRSNLYSLAVSGNYIFLASGGAGYPNINNNRIWMYDIRTGVRIASFTEHQSNGHVRDLFIDGNNLFSAGQDNKVRKRYFGNLIN